MSRKKQKIREKIIKAGLQKGHLTQQDLDQIIDDYIRGTAKRFKGDTAAAVVAKFLQRISTETRESFNQMVDEMIELDQMKVSRFRQKCMLNLIIAYHAGTVDGTNNGLFDLRQFIKGIQKELDESPEYKL